MTFDEFMQTSADLENFYEKKLNPTQVRMWFDELKYYTQERYAKAIQKVCRTSQYRPTLSTILDSVKSTQEVETMVKERVPCKACNGTGYIIYRKVIDGYPFEYACQCNCENAIGLDYDGTKVADKEHRSPYYLAKAVDVFCVSESTPSFEPVESLEQKEIGNV